MENEDILLVELTPSVEVIVNLLGDEMVALNLANGTYYGFNLVGTKIWDGLIAGERPNKICTQIAAEFGVSVGQIEADARIYLTEMLNNKLICRKT